MKIHDIINAQIVAFNEIGIVAYVEEFSTCLDKFTLICKPKVPATTNWQSFKNTLLLTKVHAYFGIILEKCSTDDDSYAYYVKYKL